MAPCWMAGSTSPSVIATGVAPSRLSASNWKSDAKMRSFLPLKSSRRRIPFFEMTWDGVAMNRPAPCRPLLAPSPSISLSTAGSAATRWPVLHRVDQSRGGHHLEALVHADEELGRDERALDGAELRTLDLPGDRAQLARRIDLGLDAAAGLLVDRGRDVVGDLVARCLQGRKRDLHHIGFLLRRLRPPGRQRRCQYERAGDHRRRCADCGFQDFHVLLPGDVMRATATHGMAPVVPPDEAGDRCQRAAARKPFLLL